MTKVVGASNRKETGWQRTKRYLSYTSPSYQAFKFGYTFGDHKYKVPRSKKVRIDKLFVKPEAKMNKEQVDKFVKEYNETGKCAKVGVIVDKKGRYLVVNGYNAVVAASMVGKSKVEVMDAKTLPLDKFPQKWKFEWKPYSKKMNAEAKFRMKKAVNGSSLLIARAILAATKKEARRNIMLAEADLEQAKMNLDATKEEEKLKIKEAEMRVKASKAEAERTIKEAEMEVKRQKAYLEGNK